MNAESAFCCWSPFAGDKWNRSVPTMAATIVAFSAIFYGFSLAFGEPLKYIRTLNSPVRKFKSRAASYSSYQKILA